MKLSATQPFAFTPLALLALLAPLALFAAVALSGCSIAPLGPKTPPSVEWRAAWGSAQLAQAPVNGVTLPEPWRQPMRDVSVRQVVRTTVAGTSVRVPVAPVW